MQNSKKTRKIPQSEFSMQNATKKIDEDKKSKTEGKRTRFRDADDKKSVEGRIKNQ